jgi:hypothetical protein
LPDEDAPAMISLTISAPLPRSRRHFTMFLDSIWEIAKLVASGALGGTAAAWSNWGIEKRRSKLAYRRELIESWRKMVLDVTRTYESPHNEDVSFTELIERREAYYSLKPHLPTETLDALKAEKNKTTIDVVTGGRKTIVNPPDRFVGLLTDDIARIERQWDLV